MNNTVWWYIIAGQRILSPRSHYIRLWEFHPELLYRQLITDRAVQHSPGLVIVISVRGTHKPGIRQVEMNTNPSQWWFIVKIVSPPISVNSNHKYQPTLPINWGCATALMPAYKTKSDHYFCLVSIIRRPSGGKTYFFMNISLIIISLPSKG